MPERQIRSATFELATIKLTKSTIIFSLLTCLLANLCSVHGTPEVSPGTVTVHHSKHDNDVQADDSEVNLNKRAAPHSYSFGLGKKSDLPDEDDIEEMNEYDNDDFAKRAGEQRFAFGLGKKAAYSGPAGESRFSFGLGKKAEQASRFAFGLGKRAGMSESRFQFGLGKRLTPENRFAFGLGKRDIMDREFEDYMKRRFSFGLGKRASPEMQSRYYFGLGRRKRSAIEFNELY